MKEETRKFLDKALQSIDAAKSLLDGGYADFAGARAYYAMFYTAEALLCNKGLKFRKHGGVHSAFGEHFAKTGLATRSFIAGCLRPLGSGSRATMESMTFSQVAMPMFSSVRLESSSPRHDNCLFRLDKRAVSSFGPRGLYSGTTHNLPSTGVGCISMHHSAWCI